MVALTKNTGRPYRWGNTVTDVPVAAGAKIHLGALLEIDSDGNVKPASKGASKTYYGVAMTEADNTNGVAAALKVDIQHRYTWLFSITDTAVRGKAAYVIDDNTVTDVATGASKCGIIVDTDSAGVWVELN